MIEIALKDGLYVAIIVVAVVGSHFMLRARVMVLEERVKGYSKAMERVFSALQRIEEKLNLKQDR